MKERKWTVTRAMIGVSFLVFGLVQTMQLCDEYKLGWPFSPYDMFAKPVGISGIYYKLTLIDSTGESLVVLPGNALPVEFFVANAIFNKVYGYGKDENQKQQLAKLVLKHVNSPWSPFQGFYRTAISPNRKEFIGFDFSYIKYDLTDYLVKEKISVVETIKGYSFREENR
ncbi:MAG: hypothetical protein AB8G05_12215 [Oligoflexales bacterium]